MSRGAATWTRAEAEQFVRRTGNMAVASALGRPGLCVSRPQEAVSGAPGDIPAGKPVRGKKRREMNKIEREFSIYLSKLLGLKQIDRFDYEGMTLRWPDGMRYTPDFVVYRSPIEWVAFKDPKDALPILLIEIKGAYGWRQDIVKFRAARAYWPMFAWEFWQKVDGEWQQTR